MLVPAATSIGNVVFLEPANDADVRDAARAAAAERDADLGPLLRERGSAGERQSHGEQDRKTQTAALVPEIDFTVSSDRQDVDRSTGNGPAQNLRANRRFCVRSDGRLSPVARAFTAGCERPIRFACSRPRAVDSFTFDASLAASPGG